MPMYPELKAKAIASYKCVMSWRSTLAPPPTRAYGLILTYECLARFGLLIRDSVNPDFDHDNKSQREVTSPLLPLVCMITIDGLFLPRWKTHLINIKNGLRYLLVLADNGSKELEVGVTSFGDVSLVFGHGRCAARMV